MRSTETNPGKLGPRKATPSSRRTALDLGSLWEFIKRRVLGETRGYRVVNFFSRQHPASGIDVRRSDPFAAMCKHVPSVHSRVEETHRRAKRSGGTESERRVNRSAAHRGRKILLRLYLFSTFFPDRATAREPASPPPRRSPLFSAALLSFSLSAYLPAVPSFAPRTRARSPTHRRFVFTSKCGIQQGFHAACGGAESAPVCRYARGQAGVASGK